MLGEKIWLVAGKYRGRETGGAEGWQRNYISRYNVAMYWCAGTVR